MRMIKKGFMKNDFIEKEDLMVKDGLRTRYSGKRSVLKMLAMAALVFVAGMCLTCAETYAGTWLQEGDGTWYYQTSNGRLTGWHWIDGNGDGTAQCYCFDPNGRMKAGTTVDGWQVNADGAWVQNGVVQTQQVAPGSHYAAGSGSAAGSAAGTAGGTRVIYAGGTGNSGTGSIGSNSGSTGAGSSNTAYTPERARMEARQYNASTDGVPYQGKVWSYDDYCYTKSEARATGKLYVNDRCNTPGCCNPHITGGLYCAVHTCKEPGCTSSLAISQYNAGYCYTHMKAHGIDEYEFTKIENAKQKAARDAAAAAAAAQAKAKSSGSSTKSSAKSSSKNSGSSSKSSSSSSSKKSSSYYDSYDDGYDDVYFDEKYDKDRYKHDRDYRNGVEDAALDLFEEEDEDW